MQRFILFDVTKVNILLKAFMWTHCQNHLFGNLYINVVYFIFFGM